MRKVSSLPFTQFTSFYRLTRCFKSTFWFVSSNVSSFIEINIREYRQFRERNNIHKWREKWRENARMQILRKTKTTSRQLKLLLVTIVTNSLLQFIDKILTINWFVEKINKFKNRNELSKHLIHECITVLLRFFFA